MTLREQVKDIAAKLFNQSYAENQSFQLVVEALAAHFFLNQTAESISTRAVRRAQKLFRSSPGITEDEPAVE
jgi:hypothetical protein